MTCRFPQLFRDLVETRAARPRLRYLAAAALGGAALAGAAIARQPAAHRSRSSSSSRPRSRLSRCASSRSAAMALARRAPRSRVGRLAHGDRQPAPARRADALGGVVARARPRGSGRADAGRRQSARRNCSAPAPGETPNFYFLDVRGADIAAFRRFLRLEAPQAQDRRGADDARPHRARSATSPAEGFKAKESVAWVLEGDRGVTFADAPPEGSQVVAGRWWDAGLCGTAAGVAGGGRRRRARPEDRRCDHRQRSRPRCDGDNLPICARLTGAASPSISSSSSRPTRSRARRTRFSSPRRCRATARRRAPLMKAAARDFPSVVGGQGARRAGDDRGADRQTGAGDPLGLRRRAGVLGSGAGERARGQSARPHRRRRDPEDIGRDARAPGGDVSDRIRAARRGDGGVRRRAPERSRPMSSSSRSWVSISSSRRRRPSPRPAAGLALTVGLGMIGAWRILGQKPAAFLREL